ncbi:MAG: hypothetical protein ACYTFI_07270 [Planctomycetota bacterium]|jgi:hypothetical protein
MMLAKGGDGIAIFVVIVAIFIIKGIVEYFRRQKAEAEARRKRLDQGGGSKPEPGGGAKARPAGGLEALLRSLAEGEAPAREREPEPPARPEPRPAEPRGEVWTMPDEPAEREPAARSFEGSRAEREAEIRRQKEHARELREEAARDGEPRRLRPSVSELRRRPVPEAAAGIAPAFARLAPEGERPSVADARKGILWSVVLGRPRALSSYGEPGSSEAPGGTFS